MSKGSRRLGRGLSSLIASDLTRPQKSASSPGVAAGPALEGLPVARQATRLLALPVDKIRHNPMQPRRRFDEQGLLSLATSLREKGTLQPVVVRPAEGGYELVAGERRLRAAKLAELDEIPAIVRMVRDDELLELALIENIHRADLNPIEKARAYSVMHERHGLSHDEIAGRVGEDRATVSNYIRLLGLSEEVLGMVSDGRLGVGHAKALLGVSHPQVQLSFAHRLVQEGWTVRRLEAAIARGSRGVGAVATERKVRPVVADMELRLSTALGTRVVIREGRRRHTGKIVIEYRTLDDFERIVGLLGLNEEPS